MSTLTSYRDHPGAQLPDDHKSRLEKMKEKLRALCERPATGRTTTLGRKVEKPGDVQPGGPSNQRDSTRHDRKHTNK